MATFTPQSKNTTTFDNQERNSNTIGETWASIITTWATESRTWEELVVISWSNQSKN